ncbi:beta-ketoacyl synthase N-terminal-like domain-containing protein [Aeromonas veronii]|uniref:beta-ketoacyl synthase N-terminal-like domain-containing protein n=1 Tax=Aeromonas veronii TaxID=654 RepID=UPI0031FE0424
MEHAAIISGFSSCLPFSENSTQLIQRLKQGQCVIRQPWFKSDEEAIKSGFNGNKFIAKLELVNDSELDLLYWLIEDTLAQAMLETHYLAGHRVRVYLTGIGPRVDGMNYNAFYNKNDVEDVLLNKSLTQLHVSKMSHDMLATNIARKYNLQHLPPNMNCTSNSSLAAVHLAHQAIEAGGLDLALVVNCSNIKTQDIWFLESQSMLDSYLVQPFGENSHGVLMAEGYSAILLESANHRTARQVRGGIRLQTAYAHISSGRSNDSTWLSYNILKLMKTVMKNADICVADLAAIIPHANGSAISDKAEAKAIAMFCDEHPIPVLAYKGQIGYTTTGSGVIDLIIGHHSLMQHELISPVGSDKIIEAVSPYVLLNGGIIKHHQSHILKIGIGVDGSIVCIIMTMLDK